jgi:carboxyl-terminal processing protease
MVAQHNLEGVSIDIVMQIYVFKNGERDVDNAIPWDKIDPAPYNVWTNNDKFEDYYLIARNELQNPQFKLIEKSFTKWLMNEVKKNLYSLKSLKSQKQ